MDSKVVNKAIKSQIWSFLREEGFSQFSSRNAWRYKQDRIEVINFQSFNSYLAGLIGCTTFSLSVNLGIYFTIIPNQFTNNPVKEKNGWLLPEEFKCIFRKQLIKSLYQDEINDRQVWYVDALGSNIELVMDDVKRILYSDGIKWFEKYSQMDAVLNTLLNEEEKLFDTWGFGRKASPIRNFAGGYIAYALQKYDLAADMIEKAINSGCFKAIEERLQQDYKCDKEMITLK